MRFPDVTVAVFHTMARGCPDRLSDAGATPRRSDQGTHVPWNRGLDSRGLPQQGITRARRGSEQWRIRTLETVMEVENPYC